MSFFEPDQKIEMFFEKEEAAEQSNVDFEIGVNAPAAKLLQVGENLIQSLSTFFVVWSLEKNGFFICYLAVPWQTCYQGDNHCYPMLITAF